MRLDSRRPFVSNLRTILLYGAGVSLKWTIFAVTWALLADDELLRTP
jgi:hypothetical protein